MDENLQKVGIHPPHPPAQPDKTLAMANMAPKVPSVYDLEVAVWGWVPLDLGSGPATWQKDQNLTGPNPPDTGSKWDLQDWAPFLVFLSPYCRWRTEVERDLLCLRPPGEFNHGGEIETWFTAQSLAIML